MAKIELIHDVRNSIMIRSYDLPSVGGLLQFVRTICDRGSFGKQYVTDLRISCPVEGEGVGLWHTKLLFSMNEIPEIHFKIYNQTTAAELFEALGLAPGQVPFPQVQP